MNINVLTVCKHSKRWVDEAFVEYSKRLPNILKINLIEINSRKVSGSASLSNISKEKVKNEEAKLIRKKLSKNSFVICLDEKGESFSSFEFSRKLENIFELSKDHRSSRLFPNPNPLQSK